MAQPVVEANLPERKLDAEEHQEFSQPKSHQRLDGFYDWFDGGGHLTDQSRDTAWTTVRGKTGLLIELLLFVGFPLAPSYIRIRPCASSLSVALFRGRGK